MQPLFRDVYKLNLYLNMSSSSIFKILDISVGSGSEFFGFGYCLEDKLRVRVSSGLNISVKFGFGFELSGFIGFHGFENATKSPII